MRTEGGGARVRELKEEEEVVGSHEWMKGMG